MNHDTFGWMTLVTWLVAFASLVVAGRMIEQDRHTLAFLLACLGLVAQFVTVVGTTWYVVEGRKKKA